MAKKGVLNCKKVYRMMEIIYEGNMTKETIKEDEIIQLIQTVREVFLSQPMMLELEPPINVCGDIHGQYDDLKRLFDKGGWPPEKNYLFLGDYVDRGAQGMETIVFLLALKYLFPENFFLLRGNHESDMVNKIYGFFDECKSRFSVKLWKEFINVFDVMPMAAVIGDKIFCCHGGISPDLVDAKTLSALESAKRPCKIPEKGLLCDLVWADPAAEDDEGFNESDRGVSYTFGKDVLKKFLEHFEFDLLCRAHQVVEMGYEFFAEQKGLTIFSAPNYCGEYDNAAALLVISEDLMCQFELLSPTDDEAPPQAQAVTAKLADRLQYGGVVTPDFSPSERSFAAGSSSSSSNPLYQKTNFPSFDASRLASSSDLLVGGKQDTYQSASLVPSTTYLQSHSSGLMRMQQRPRLMECGTLRGTSFEQFHTPPSVFLAPTRQHGSPTVAQKLAQTSPLPFAGAERSSIAPAQRGLSPTTLYMSQMSLQANFQNARQFGQPRDGSMARLGMQQYQSHQPHQPHQSQTASSKLMLPRGARMPNVPIGLAAFMFAPPRSMGPYATLNSAVMAPDRLPLPLDSFGVPRVTYVPLGSLQPRMTSPLAQPSPATSLVASSPAPALRSSLSAEANPGTQLADAPEIEAQEQPARTKPEPSNASPTATATATATTLPINEPRSSDCIENSQQSTKSKTKQAKSAKSKEKEAKKQKHT